MPSDAGPASLAHFARARAVAERERRLDAELAGLLDHRAAGGVHAAVEDHVGVLALHLGQDRLEVGRLVVGLFARDDLHAGGLQRLLDFVGEAFAVGRRVVGDRDLLRLELIRHVRGDRRTLLVVAADGAEHDLEALFGELRVRRRAGDHRQAGLVVDGRGGNRHAGVQVADHAGDLGVDELLGDRRAHLRVGLVVLAHHLELDDLAADLDLPRGGFVDGEVHAVLVVLAEVGDAAGQRAGMADLDRHDFFGGRPSGLRLSSVLPCRNRRRLRARPRPASGRAYGSCSFKSSENRGMPTGQQAIIGPVAHVVNPPAGHPSAAPRRSRAPATARRTGRQPVAAGFSISAAEA